MTVNTYSYGPVAGENFLSFDLYTSPESTSSTPLIALVHGGAWRSEDKADYKDLALGFNKLGFSVASINYRLSLKDEGQEVSAIQHPDHYIDVGKAIEYLSTTPPSQQYNPKQIYIVGHSAGGHIASMLLLDTSLPFHNYIAGIIGVSGIYDIPLLIKTFPSYLDFIAQAFGNDQASYFDASPVSKTPTQLNNKKIIIAQSPEDTLINNEQAEVMMQHLTKMGANVVLDMTVKGDHYKIMNIENLAPLVQSIVSSSS